MNGARLANPFPVPRKEGAPTRGGCSRPLKLGLTRTRQSATRNGAPIEMDASVGAAPVMLSYSVTAPTEMEAPVREAPIILSCPVTASTT